MSSTNTDTKPRAPSNAAPPKSHKVGKVNNTTVATTGQNPVTGKGSQRSRSAPVKVTEPHHGHTTPMESNKQSQASTKPARKYTPNTQRPLSTRQQQSTTTTTRATTRVAATQHLSKSTQNCSGDPEAASLKPKPEAVPLGVGAKVDGATVQAVEVQTRGQSGNPKWFSWRQNRITASTAHRVSHSRFVNGQSKTPPESYVKAILGEGQNIKTRAMTWGIQHEAEVVKIYQRLKSKSLGRAVKVQDCGLFIDPQRAWLAASPDGIVVDKQSGERLLCLEVKCPYKHRENTVREACIQDSAFCLELADDDQDHTDYRLKTKHSYYTQVQCQMAVTGLHRADLVVYTLRETAVVPVTFDPEFWSDNLPKLETFYREAVLPRLREKGQVAPPMLPEE